MKVKLGSGNESIRELQNFFIKNNLQPYLNVLITVLLTWGIYFVYIFPKMLYRTEKGITAGWVNIWGDWPTHFAFASRFAYTRNTDFCFRQYVSFF